ncbi:MarR family winged helix-turn-helix transcriptional regulator [Pelagibius sp. Alg239-R121]|uniref:MarR family winged helix-turn-helix transcriptional regulator n=1 Tax=Pelagibius sp. Alg239-R121 TaxID=2993448 RepID=UPI0024A68308|nr:MarR family winged helix-turn-helix transcriptional regulator [Pelagibius sp. Alg239-R121]
MKNEPNETAVRAWTQLMRAQNAALTQVEQSFKDAGFPPLTWYDVLWELERGDRAGMRPFELESHLLVPQYGLSRLLDRVEKAGYVERRPCDGDGRGQVVVITKLGRQLRRRMWQVYAPALNSAVADRLTAKETATLSRLLGKLLP